MATPIRRLSLPRRTFLRGAGASIALPFLSAMSPALVRRDDACAQPIRTCFVFAPNGKKMNDWTPEGRGTSFRFGHTLEPLDPFRKDVLIVSGLALDGGRAHGDGAGDHARAAGSYLTCAHPKKTGGADIRVGVSVDQVIAAQVGAATPFPSLQVGMEGGRRAGSCDSGYSCAYSNNISWRSATTPVAKETRPSQLFKRLFGDPDDVADRERKRRQVKDRRSVLDLALRDVRRLRRDLGAEDRRKLDEYLDAVRELEVRLSRSEPEDSALDVPAHLLDRSGSGYAERLRLMYDLIAVAFQADLSRTVTFMLGNAGSNRSYRNIGVSEGHHDLSHHGKKPHKLDGIRKINRWHAEQFAHFLSRLRETKEGGKDLLDQSMVLYGSGLADGNRHAHHDLPVLVAGRGGGALKTGRHLVFPRNTPMANLYLSLMDKAGVSAATFADASGRLDI